MTMGLIPDGKKPRVETHPRGIAIWVGKGGSDATGIVMSPQAAIDSGIALIAEGVRSTGQVIALREANLELSIAEPISEEIAALFTFTAEGAGFAIELSAQQVVDMAAAFRAAAEDIG
jgi:hypothetical protein